jgi:hypothetical protein
MKAGSLVAYPLASVCLFLACSAESRPFDTIRKSFEQSPLHDLVMPPAAEVSTGVIISDVIGKTQSIAIFSGLTRDIAAVAGRLDNAGQNATVLAPDNSVMRDLKRKPWEDPEDYDTFGTSAYEGTAGADRAQKNLERFVQRHIIPESPWEEGKVRGYMYELHVSNSTYTFAEGPNSCWQRNLVGKKRRREESKYYKPRFCSRRDPLPQNSSPPHIPSTRKSFSTFPNAYICWVTLQTHHQSNTSVRWPSWLWR